MHQEEELVEVEIVEEVEVVVVEEVEVVEEVVVVLSPLWKYAAMSLASRQETSQSAKKAEVTSRPGFLLPPSIPPSAVLGGFTVCSPGAVTSVAPGSQRPSDNWEPGRV